MAKVKRQFFVVIVARVF